MKLIAIDPGFAELGIACVEHSRAAHGPTVLAYDLLRTEKDDKKRNVLAADDNVIRLLALWRQVGAFLALPEAKGAVAICAEAQSWPRNASASAKIGMAWGLVTSVAAQAGLPIFQLSPQRVKKELTGVLTASKDEIATAVYQRTAFRFDVPSARGRKIPPTQQEHVTDAIAVALALPVHPGWPLLWMHKEQP